MTKVFGILQRVWDCNCHILLIGLLINRNELAVGDLHLMTGNLVDAKSPSTTGISARGSFVAIAILFLGKGSAALTMVDATWAVCCARLDIKDVTKCAIGHAFAVVMAGG